MLNGLQEAWSDQVINPALFVSHAKTHLTCRTFYALIDMLPNRTCMLGMNEHLVQVGSITYKINKKC